MASSYEKATRMVIDTYYRRIAQEIVSGINKGIILDLGTGPGYLPIEMAKLAPSIQIIGIDLSRKLIRMALKNASEAGLSERLTFLRGNSAGLRFENACFDMVTSTGMLHSLKDPVKVLREIYRVLKEGKEAWIYDPSEVESQIDIQKWKTSLTYRDKFFLRVFKLFKLQSASIKTYNREQAVSMVEATDFKKYWIDYKNNKIKIRLLK